MRMPDGYINILHSNAKGTEVTVEQRELVLCKHCKYFEPENVETTGVGWCEVYDNTKSPNGFCDEGKQRDGKDGNEDE